MGRLGVWELLVIFLIILILFGAKKLPEIGNALGKALKEFRKAGKDAEKDPPATDQDKNETE
jgi:sec-independent protein translocase protein TatA